MKKLLLSFFVLVVFIFTTNVFSQTVGDYGTIGSASWETIANWVVCTTNGTWVGATAAVTVPPSSANVWIRSGHTVNMQSGGKVCNNITIESGALLYGNSAVTTPKYLRVYGSTMTVDGTFGGVADAAGISPYVASQTLTIMGNGTCNVSRIQPNQAGITVIIDINMGINYAGSDGTGSTALYTAGKEDYTVRINAGKTVTMANSAYVSTTNSGGDAAGVVNFTIDVYGTLTCSGTNSKFNLNTSASKTASLTIYNGGVVNINSYLRGNATNLGTVNVNVHNGGTLNGYSGSFFDLSTAVSTIDGTVDFGQSSTATRSLGTATIGSTGLLRFQDGTYPTGSVTLNAGSTVEYYGGSAITLGASPTAYSNLLVTNTAGVTLGAALAVSNLFSIVSGASVDLGSFTHTTEYLKLAGVDQTPGTHGSTASTATYQNATYFGSSATGLLIVNAALPVELSSFNANAKNGLVQLSWRTISETNSLMFDVERKIENSEWTKIGEVIAAGNSNSLKDYSFADSKLTSGKYQYRLKMIDADGSYQYSNIAEVEISLPGDFSLSQNYPNPFNPSTTISYQLAASTFVTLKVYDILGNEIATLVNEQQEAGFYSLPFTTSEKQLANGMYIYRIQAGDFSQTKKMLLIK